MKTFITKVKTEMKNRDIHSDNQGIAPIIWGLLVAITVVAGAGAYSYFSQPDVTYNIAEGGLFNIAGVEISSLELVAVAIAILLIIFYIFKSRKSND